MLMRFVFQSQKWTANENKACRRISQLKKLENEKDRGDSRKEVSGEPF